MRTRLDLFVLAALGVYRLWRLLAHDEITARPRETLYNRWPPSANRAAGWMKWSPEHRQMVMRARSAAPNVPGSLRKPPKVSWMAKWWDCPWCMGASLSAAATIAVDVSFGVVWPVLWWLALSTAVGLLGRADG